MSNHQHIVERYQKTYDQFGLEIHEALMAGTPVSKVCERYRNYLEDTNGDGEIFKAYKKYALTEEHFNFIQREAMSKIRKNHPEFRGEMIPTETLGMARMLMTQYLTPSARDPNDYDIPTDRRGELIDRFVELFQASPEKVKEAADKIADILVTFPSAKKLAEAIKACQPAQKSIREGLSGFFSHLKLNGQPVNSS